MDIDMDMWIWTMDMDMDIDLKINVHVCLKIEYWNGNAAEKFGPAALLLPIVHHVSLEAAFGYPVRW